MSLPVAILAGGLATRLGPVTATIPKSLVDVAGRPFIAHQLGLLQRSGYTDIVLLVGKFGEMIVDVLGNGSAMGVRLRYVFDGPMPLGTGGALKRALPELGDAFLALYGDSYLDCDYAAVERAFDASGKRALMTVFHNDGLFDRSNVLYENGRIVKYDKARNDGMRHIDFGLGAFKAAVFASRSDEAFDLAVLYQTLLAADDLAGFEVSKRFYEIGSPGGLEEARAYLLGQKGAP